MGDKMKDKSKLIAIILVIVTTIVVVVSFIIDSRKDKENNEINIVTNYSNFYTVNSCLYRVITYLSTKNIDDLMLVIDDKYKEENNITKENILSIFDSVEENSTFVSKKMYYQNLNDNITKYYVYGYIEKNQLYDGFATNKLQNKEMYFIVYIDSKNKIFSIEPYTGDIFIGGDINE